MSMKNQTKILGNLVRDPEVKVTKTGNTVANFTVACNQTYKDKEGKWQSKDPIYINVNAWGINAEKAMTLNRGTAVCVEGTLEDNIYKNKNGVEVKEKRIRASNIFLQIKIKSKKDDEEAWSEESWVNTSI